MRRGATPRRKSGGQVQRALQVLAVALAAAVAGTLLASPITAAARDQADPGEGTFEVGLPVALRGDALVRAEAPYLRVLDGGPGLRLTGSAERLTVVRTFTTVTAVQHPSSNGDLFAWYGEPQQTLAAYRDATFDVARAGAESTLFVQPSEALGYRGELTGVAATGVLVAHEAQDVSAESGAATAGDASTIDYRLRAAIDAPHFTLDATGFTGRVTGNFTFFLWDVDLRVLPSGQEASVVETGETERGAAPAEERAIANALVTVTNADLVVSGVDSLTLYAPAVTAGLTGTAILPDAVGAYRAAEDAYEARGEDVAVTGAVVYSFDLVRDATDRALVQLAGDVRSISLAPTALLDPGAFFASPAGKATAFGGGLVLVVGAVLATRHRDALAGLVAKRRLRPRSGPASADPAEAAVLALEAGDDALAARLFERALEARPDDVVLLVDYGTTLERLGRATRARDAYERAVRLAPTRGEAHYYYSRALATLGLTASALPHLQRALALDPRLREMARRDPAFRVLSDHPSYLALVA